MKLFFEITAGDRQGSRFAIRNGLTVGRKQADIILRDSKVSSRHAQVEERDDGLYLVDAGSANGLKVEGKKQTEVRLLPGTTIQLGRTSLVVIDTEEAGFISDAPIVKAWQESVADIVNRVEQALDNVQPLAVYSFSTPVELEALSGIQKGERWTLVYGPREVGAASLDVRLSDPKMPASAFSICERDQRLMLISQHADVVLVNGAQMSEEQTINDGDEIAVYNTRLKVKLLANSDDG